MTTATETKNCRILVIDDNPSIHEDFSRVLTPVRQSKSQQFGRAVFQFDVPQLEQIANFEVDSSYQGQDGLVKVQQAIAEGRPYAAIFVDVRMPPGWDGIQTLEQIWKADPDIEAVICTAFSDYSWEDIYRRFGRTGQLLILKKPFDKIELQQMATTSVERWNLKREAREAANQLQISRERLSTTLQSIGDAVISTDIKGRVTDLNRVAEHLIGVSRSDAIGREITQILNLRDADDKQPIENPISEVLHEKHAISLPENAELVTTSNNSIAIDDCVTPIRGENNEVTGAVIVLRDVSEKRRAQQEIRRLYYEAMDANRLKDEFLAVVSHELRTPLQSIISWLDLLKMGKMKHDETVRAVQIIEKNTKAQRQLIEDLLDISRIASGKLILDLQPVSIADVVLGAIEIVRPAARTNQIHFALNIQRDLQPIKADAGRLQQVVWNLLTNSIKFTPEGGTISVEVTQDSEQTAITVRDTGRGISPEFLPHVFERFRQEPAVKSGSSRAGLGLGLSIVKNLVELHGGQITAHSDGEGKGARFDIVLPRNNSKN